MEVEINKIKKEVKAIVSKIKNNIEKREEYGEKKHNPDWISGWRNILVFDSDGEAVVLKDCQVVTIRIP